MRVTGLQVRRAWEAYHKRCVLGLNLTFDAMASQLIKAMGLKEAQSYVSAQSNDPHITTEIEATYPKVKSNLADLAERDEADDRIS